MYISQVFMILTRNILQFMISKMGYKPHAFGNNDIDILLSWECRDWIWTALWSKWLDINKIKQVELSKLDSISKQILKRKSEYLI